MLLSVAGMHVRPNAVSDWRQYDRKTAIVTRVDTADRLQVTVDGATVPIRLLGIAAPETGGRADSAMSYATKRLLHQSITLRLEPTQSRDADGVVLAYAFLADTDDFNLDAVRDGRVFADRRQPHTFASAFEAAEADARKKSRGLWLGLKDADQPAWRQAWLTELRAERAQRSPTTRPTLPAKNQPSP